MTTGPMHLRCVTFWIPDSTICKTPRLRTCPSRHIGVRYSRTLAVTRTAICGCRHLVLWGFGLAAFYFLCREHGLGRREAGLLVLGLFSCPLIIKMSFSFMTDIPYLSCLIIALFLYTRALSLRRYDLMYLASLAGSAAILTRQFGAVLIAAAVLVWAVSDNRRRNIALVATGIALPLIALRWQLHTGIAQPTGGTRMIFYQLSQYSFPIRSGCLNPRFGAGLSYSITSRSSLFRLSSCLH